jgi:hypothetical protein
VSDPAHVCPNGHASDETDYCSVCGAAMTSGASANPAGECPECRTPRVDASARFCEVCRYDFEARSPGPPPTASLQEPKKPEQIEQTGKPGRAQKPGKPPTKAAELPTAWQVTITVDPSLDVEPDPATPAPTDQGERQFPVDLPEMLIGRRDDRRDIRPEIPVMDPAVSRRHAKLLTLPGGGLAILDLASANGTAVNGTAITAGDRHELADGDAITLGRWTRIVAHQKA